MAVSLYSDASGVPGSSLFTFTNPTGGVTSGAVNTFTAPANTTLTGGTTYHIVVSSPSVGGSFVQVKLDRTTSNAEDDAGEDDWEIGNNGYFAVWYYVEQLDAIRCRSASTAPRRAAGRRPAR